MKHIPLTKKIVEELVRASPYKVSIRPTRFGDGSRGYFVGVEKRFGNAGTSCGQHTRAEAEARALCLLREYIRTDKEGRLREKLINEATRKAMLHVEYLLAKPRRKDRK